MKKRDYLEPLIIFGLFVFLALLFYYPVFFDKIPFNTNLLVTFWSPWEINLPFKYLGVDEVREFYPLFDFGFESLKQGQLPFWNPYNFSGTPHLANWASAVFYPLNLLGLVLNKIQAYVLLKISAAFLAGFFTYFYCQTLSLNKRASFLGGAAFAFSSTMLIWEAEFWQASHTLLWLPLVLWAIEKHIQTKNKLYLILGGLGLALSVIAGYTQTTIYVYLFTFTYILFRRSLMALFIFPLSFLFSAIHTLPAFEFFWLSPRKEIALTQVNLDFLLSLKHFVTLFVPDIFGHITTLNWYAPRPGQYYEQMIYVGVVPLALASLAFFLKKLRGQIIFYFLWVLISLSLVFNLPTSRLIYYWQIPFLSTAIPIRIIFLTAFSFSLLAAMGLSWWLESKKQTKKIVLALAPLIVIYGLITFFLYQASAQEMIIPDFPADWYLISLRNLVIPGAVFLLTACLLILGGFLASLRRFLYFLLLFLLLVHAFIFAHKYFPFGRHEYLYPPHPLLTFVQENVGVNRFWGYYQGRLENNFNLVYRIATPEGYDPVNPKRYNQLLSAANGGEFSGIASRSDALIPTGNIPPLEDEHPYRLKMLDFLGVKYIGYDQQNEDEKIYESERFKPVWQKDNWHVFENKKAFPRAFLVPEVIYGQTDEETIKLVLDPEIDLHQKVVFTGEAETFDLGEEATGEAKIVDYAANKIEIKAITSAPQFLVLTDSYYPAWQAKIDDQPTKIYPANHAFRAIKVPAGEHQIVFKYQSLWFKIGALITLLSFLGALVFAILKTKHA